MKRLLFFLLSLLCFLFTRGDISAEPADFHPELIYHEFHYDRKYPDNYRVIAAFRFAEIPELPAAPRQIISALVFDGLDYRDYAEKVMRGRGGRFIDMGKYRFTFGANFWDDPAWEELRDERRPVGAPYPFFECVISFESFDIVFASEEFIIFQHDWEEHPSDAAHGNYDVDYKTVDLRNEAIPQMSDLLAPQALKDLDTGIRSLLREQNILAGQEYPGELPKPDSFVFEKSGLRLIWEPHPATPFVDGIVSVLLPYPEVESYLTVDGRRLMRALKQ